MKFTTEYVDQQVAAIRVEGEIDLYSSSDLRAAFTDLLNRSYNRILLNVEQLHYIDSSGVGVLIHLLQSLRTRDGQLAVVGLHGSPERVLTMSNIISLLTVYPTNDRAVEELAGRRDKCTQ